MNTKPQTILFLHIPKSAGTTLTSVLSSNYYNIQYKIHELQHKVMHRFYQGDIFYYPSGFYKDPKEGIPEYIAPILRLPELKLITGHFSYGIHNYVQSEAKYITILRNPVDRVISLYYHLVSMKVIAEGISLDQFIEGIPEEGWLVNLSKWHPINPGYSESEIRNFSKCIVDNDQTRRISGMEPSFGQCTESMFIAACQNIKRDFLLVGLTEKFDETMLLLRTKLEWEKDVYYVPKLVNRNKPKITSMPDDLVSKIEKLNFWDKELYEFAKKLFENSVAELGPGFQNIINEFKQSNNNFSKNASDAKEWDIGSN